MSNQYEQEIKNALQTFEELYLECEAGKLPAIDGCVAMLFSLEGLMKTTSKEEGEIVFKLFASLLFHIKNEGSFAKAKLKFAAEVMKLHRDYTGSV